MLKDPSPHVRTYAVAALGGIHPVASESLRALLDRLRPSNEEQSDVRKEVAYQLSFMESLGKVVVPELVRALNDDPDAWVRRGAMNALGTLGPASQSAIPVLRALVEDPSPIRVLRKSDNAAPERRYVDAEREEVRAALAKIEGH